MAAKSSIDLESDVKAIVGSRVVAAPRELVWSVWTDPKHLAQWRGPNGFRTTTSAFDFKPGGVWRFVMHGPDGHNYPNDCVFEDIESPRKVVIQHVVEPLFHLTILLTSTAAGTLVSWAQAFESSEVASRIEHIVVPANEQNLDRLSIEVLRKSRDG